MCGAAAFVDSEDGRRTSAYNLYSTVEMLTTHDGPATIDATKARYWSEIAIFAPVRKSPSEYCHKVEKLEWWIYNNGEKNLKICLLISTEYTNETDRRTDIHRMTA